MTSLRQVGILIALTALLFQGSLSAEATAPRTVPTPGNHTIEPDENSAAKRRQPPFSVQVRLIKDGPTVPVYATQWSGDDWQGRHQFTRSMHEVDMNVYRVVEDEPNYNYYFINMDVTRKSGSGRGGGWKSFITWTDYKVSETSYTKQIPARDTSRCYTISAGISVGIGPVSPSFSMSKSILCGGLPSIKFSPTVSTPGRGGAWTAYNPGDLKFASFQKFIRVKLRPGKPIPKPIFRVRFGHPCHYSNPVGDLMRPTCYEYYNLKY